MLCDDCIAQLASIISEEGRSVLYILSKSNNKLKKGEIQELSDLTYSLNNIAINELESKLFIDYEVQGRSHVYFLTKNGKRLIQLYGKGG